MTAEKQQSIGINGIELTLGNTVCVSLDLTFLELLLIFSLYEEHWFIICFPVTKEWIILLCSCDIQGRS